MKLQLVDIKKIPVRDLWPNEEYDFTPWLQENISKLGEALGMDLEVIDREVKVGPYSADLLARDNNIVSEQNKVVIENQYGKTNHDHLGKSITYASVLGANTVVWIAENFSEEHLRAMEWLNELSPEDIGFYAVQVELWKLSDTTANVRFTIVCQPNTLVREAADGIAKKDKNEHQLFMLKYWQDFRERLLEEKSITSAQKAQAQNWFDVSLGKSHIHAYNNISRKHGDTIKSGVYIQHQIADSMLPFLEERKDEIESKLGFSLVWDQNADRIDKVIYISKEGLNLDDDQDYNDSIEWLVEKTVTIKKVFSPIIKEFK